MNVFLQVMRQSSSAAAIEGDTWNGSISETVIVEWQHVEGMGWSARDVAGGLQGEWGPWCSPHRVYTPYHHVIEDATSDVNEESVGYEETIKEERNIKIEGSESRES